MHQVLASMLKCLCNGLVEMGEELPEKGVRDEGRLCDWYIWRRFGCV